MGFDQNDLNEISGAYNAKVGLMQSSGHKANTITGTSLADQLKIKEEENSELEKKIDSNFQDQTINRQAQIKMKADKLNWVGVVAIFVIIGVVVFFLLR